MTAKDEGLRYEEHRIVRSRSQRVWPACVAVLADGTTCDRLLNRVFASDGKRYWRHNPRPYHNTHEMTRRTR